MIRGRNPIDRKSAAAGERDDNEEGALCSTESLLEALKPSKVTPGIKLENKPVKEAEPTSKATASDDAIPMATQYRTIVQPPYDYGIEKFDLRLSEIPKVWQPWMGPFFADDCEVIMEVGSHMTGVDLKLSLGFVDGATLGGGQVTRPLLKRVNGDEEVGMMTKHHPALHSLMLNRNEMFDDQGKLFTGLLLEVGFRVNGDKQSIYLGKTKWFFPKEYNRAIVYLDMTRLLLGR